MIITCKDNFWHNVAISFIEAGTKTLSVTSYLQNTTKSSSEFQPNSMVKELRSWKLCTELAS